MRRCVRGANAAQCSARKRIISAAMLTAISSGVSALMGRPMGACTRAANAASSHARGGQALPGHGDLPAAADAADVPRLLFQQLRKDGKIRLVAAGHDDGVIVAPQRQAARGRRRILEQAFGRAGKPLAHEQRFARVDHGQVESHAHELRRKAARHMARAKQIHAHRARDGLAQQGRAVRRLLKRGGAPAGHGPGAGLPGRVQRHLLHAAVRKAAQ